MEQKNIELVKNYYNAMTNKDLDTMAKCLHEDIHFHGPLADRNGKDELLEASKIFFSMIDGLKLNDSDIFANADKVMLAYDLHGKEPVGTFRVAALITIKDDLIFSLELFYDSMPFEKRRQQIEEENQR